MVEITHARSDKIRIQDLQVRRLIKKDAGLDFLWPLSDTDASEKAKNFFSERVFYIGLFFSEAFHGQKVVSGLINRLARSTFESVPGEAQEMDEKMRLTRDGSEANQEIARCIARLRHIVVCRVRLYAE
ncbi:MAG: hypothetical protein IH624_00445 [Phycisphaerae bacterium]|nr:hypothetical protein [Phycisphaerae bacterium]